MANKKLMEAQKTIQNLKEIISEMSDHICHQSDDLKRATRELEYLNAFITYHKLEDSYAYFRENTHEETDPNLPFSTLTL